MYKPETDITKLPKRIILPDTLDIFFAGKKSPLKHIDWNHIIRSSAELSINPIFIVARVIMESGWRAEGRIAQKKNNCLGYGAFDKDPYKSAMRFASWTDCVIYVLHNIHRYYVVKRNLKTIHQIMQRYSTARDSQSTADLMNQIESFRVKAEENI